MVSKCNHIVPGPAARRAVRPGDGRFSFPHRNWPVAPTGGIVPGDRDGIVQVLPGRFPGAWQPPQPPRMWGVQSIAESLLFVFLALAFSVAHCLEPGPAPSHPEVWCVGK